MKNLKVLNVKFKKGTIIFAIANFITQEVFSLYFQFTFKDPWWLPKYEPHFAKADIPLYGWLFFYFGRLTKGVVIPSNEENAKIKDSLGNTYEYYGIKEREYKDKFRKIVKYGNCSFEIDSNGEITAKERFESKVEA